MVKQNYIQVVGLDKPKQSNKQKLVVWNEQIVLKTQVKAYISSSRLLHRWF